MHLARFLRMLLRLSDETTESSWSVSLSSRASTNGGQVDTRVTCPTELIDPDFLAKMRRKKDEMPRGGDGNKLCQVCSDIAIGYHHGVPSCEACRVFFHRCIRGSLDYVCSESNTCNVYKNNRKGCPACRLRKCYEVGMAGDNTVTKAEGASSCSVSLSSPVSTNVGQIDTRGTYLPELVDQYFLANLRQKKDEMPRDGDGNKLCQVCSDIATGYHHGVPSCEACRVFFHRCIRGTLDHVCSESNTCNVYKNKRKCCPACRLRKCYEVGMVGDKTVTTAEDPSPWSVSFSSPALPNADQVDTRDIYPPELNNPYFLANLRQNKDGMPHRGDGNKLCQVCSDIATGFNHGVLSCEACRVFFHRSIRGPVDYVCDATSTCKIYKNTRTCCPACRLRKCYEVGMADGPRSMAGERITTDSSQTATKKSTELSTIYTFETCLQADRNARATLIIESLSKVDLPNMEINHNHSLPPTRIHLLSSFVKIVENKLIFIIGWAKNVPGYKELTLQDQIHLIRCCWIELLLLNCAFNSMKYGGNRLVIAPDLILEKSHWSVLGMTDLMEHVAAISTQLLSHNLHNEEFLLLQATVLANAEVRRLASFRKLKEMRQLILDSLIDTGYKYHPGNLSHVASLILLLTHLRRASERALFYLQGVKKERLVSFCDLLAEMLDGHLTGNRQSVAVS